MRSWIPACAGMTGWGTDCVSVGAFDCELVGALDTVA